MSDGLLSVVYARKLRAKVLLFFDMCKSSDEFYQKDCSEQMPGAGEERDSVTT